MISVRQVRVVDAAFAAHLQRVALEDASEQFAGVDWNEVASRYRNGALLRTADPGWARLWIAEDDAGRVCAHASLLDFQPEGDVCNGHISVEVPHRGTGVAQMLQQARFQWLDRHVMTLLGPVAPGNERSFRACLRAGFRAAHYDEHTGAVWMARYPRGG